MLPFLQTFFVAFWSVTREAAPFLVLGLLLAGILHVLVPPRVVLWALGPSGLRGALRGAALGVPLPLCSCSVLPTALTLRRQGASLSATTAFMISTPETSVDALAVTAALLPPVFLGVRPLAAFVLSVAVGAVVERFAGGASGPLRKEPPHEPGRPASEASELRRQEQMSEICRVCGLAAESGHPHSAWDRLSAVMRYAFGDFFKDIGSWIVAGLLFAALVEITVPQAFFREAWWVEHPGAQILLAAVVGVPLYSCATATTPFVATLIAKGLNPGAALVLLLTGPATNLGTVFVLKREFGARVTALYYASLVAVCLAMGFAMDAAWPIFSRFPSLTRFSAASMSEGSGGDGGLLTAIEIACAVLLLLLVARGWVASFFRPRRDSCCGGS